MTGTSVRQMRNQLDIIKDKISRGDFQGAIKDIKDLQRQLEKFEEKNNNNFCLNKELDGPKP